MPPFTARMLWMFASENQATIVVKSQAPTKRSADMPDRHPTPQSGITNRPPEHCIVGAFRLDTTDPVSTRQALDALKRIERSELRSDLDDQGPATDKAAPSPETGELGFGDGHDRAHLTITTCFGVGTFERLGTPVDQRPQDLIAIPAAPAFPPVRGDLLDRHGHRLVLIDVVGASSATRRCSRTRATSPSRCAPTMPYVCEHAIRRVEQELAGQVTLLWTQIGSQRYTSRQGRTSRREGRSVSGFIDGTSNLDPRHTQEGRRLTFVDPESVAAYPTVPVDQPAGYGGAPGTAFPADLRSPPPGEPGWTRNGAYMVVRSSMIDTAAWDRITLGEQEADMGRFKFSGAFLDLSDDPARIEETPAFEVDQASRKVAVDSHARKSNPRRPEDMDRQIFRRGYPLISGGPAGFDRGLLFIAFARSISTQFEFIFRAWMRNPNFPDQNSGADRLFPFQKQVMTGGYYFVPPIEHPGKPWTWVLPA